MATTAAEYLRSALRALQADRADLDRQIEVIQRTLAELSPSGDGAPVVPPPFKPGRPIRDIALELAAEGQVFTLQEVVDRARAEGNSSQYASVSSMLSRLAKEGHIEKGPRRGTYQPAHGEESGKEWDGDAGIDHDAGDTDDAGHASLTNADGGERTQPDPGSNPGIQTG